MRNITKEIVLSLLRVDFQEGKIFWIKRGKGRPSKNGTEAGGKYWNTGKNKEYWRVWINGKNYRRGQIVFLAAYGKLPTPCVDHINGDGLDDRLSNLREATYLENNRNRKTQRKGKKLPLGVSFVNGGYTARIINNKKHIWLGLYGTKEEAEAVYKTARRELFGEFA